MPVVNTAIKGGVFAWLARRRFPTLLVIAAGLLVADMFMPDPVPFIDEILLMIVTTALASWRKRPARAARGERVVIDHDTQQPV